MSSFTRKIVEAAVALRFEDLPDDVIEIVRQCVLDWLGVTLAGSREPGPLMVLEELSPYGSGPATVVGHPVRLGPYDAALVNGTASHALDYDDVNEAMLGHPSVAILAGLLALAEVEGRSGAEVVTAFVAGYEAECRIARALGFEHYQRGFHATGTAGTFGAALAAARLLGLDADRAEMAVGLAATRAAGLKSMFGTMTKPLHAGLASAAGLFSARLAGRGFTAAAGSIEVPQGFAETHAAGFDPDRGLAPPPSGWYLRANLFKYNAACFQTHSSIEGLRRLRDQAGLEPGSVERVTIHADAAQMRMCAIPEPRTGLEVKFSLRHTAAMALAGVDTAAAASFSDDTAVDPGLVSLRDRIEVVADRSGSGPTPVEVRLHDGRLLSAAHDVSVPETDLGRQRSRLEEKFTSLAGPGLGTGRGGALAGLCRRLDQLADVGELMGRCGG